MPDKQVTRSMAPAVWTSMATSPIWLSSEGAPLLRQHVLGLASLICQNLADTGDRGTS